MRFEKFEERINKNKTEFDGLEITFDDKSELKLPFGGMDLDIAQKQLIDIENNICYDIEDAVFAKPYKNQTARSGWINLR